MTPPIRLPSDRSASPLAQSWARLKQVRGLRDLRRWSLKAFRLAGLPLRIRPAFVLFTFLTLLVLSLLGFHPTLAARLAPPQVPFSDKVLHFVCFGLATSLFYAIWVVEEHARRVWFWRWWNELAALVVCVLVGGIGSEFVQALLPYKTFQPGDILANLLGSSLGILVSHHISRESRRSAELRRLYVHLDQLSESDESADEEEDEVPRASGAAEREMEEGRARAEGQLRGDGEGRRRTAAGGISRQEVNNPWDDREEEEIFGLGGEEDDEEREQLGRRR
ncbi:hypothetical protein JCM21900_000236 [Sporobolomyces salmonicolor]